MRISSRLGAVPSFFILILEYVLVVSFLALALAAGVTSATERINIISRSMRT